MSRRTAPPKGQIKRLTLDLPADLHRALKIRSVELDVAMVELLSALIEDALSRPAAVRDLAKRLQRQR